MSKMHGDLGGSNDMRRQIAKMIRSITGEDKDKEEVVIKTFPATAEWKASFAELNKMSSDLRKEFQRMQNKQKQLWATIEQALDIYSEPLQWNEQTQEIELLGEAGEGKPRVVSPFQKADLKK